MNSIGDKIEIIEIEEEEIDWINPELKAINTIPEELINSSSGSMLSDRILRKPNSDLFLIYYSDKLFLLNSSNLHSVTKDIIKNTQSILATNSLCTINFGKEIKRISVNPHEPDYFCIIFEDSIQVFGFTELTRYVGNPPFIKTILKPALYYKIPTNQSGVIHSAYVFDSIDLKIILASKNEIIITSSGNEAVSSPKYKKDITDLLILEGSIIVVSSGDDIHQLTYSGGPKGFQEMKNINIQSILQEDEENEYRISYLAQFKSFLCVGILQKNQDSEWKDFSQISQNFLFLEYSIDQQTFNLKSVQKNEWVFNYNDDYEFKTEPRFQSVFYEEYNIFILTSNQYHQAEIFNVEEDIDGYKIQRGSFEDDKRIFVPKNKKNDKMSLCQGISIIDFKLDGYESEKLTLKSEEIFTPPLVILCNDIGNLVVYYLPNQRDLKSVLKQKFKNPQNILNRSYDSKQEEKSNSNLKENLFGSSAIVPPNKLSIPEGLKDSPKNSKKGESKASATLLADCFKVRKEMVETQTMKKLEKNVINSKEEEKNITKENTKQTTNLNQGKNVIKEETTTKNQIKIEQNITKEKEATNIELIEEKTIAENEAEQLKNIHELRRKLQFEKLSNNLKRQLDLYKEVISYHCTDMFELLISLDKQVNLTKSEHDLDEFIKISDKACKEFFNFDKIVPDFKKYLEKISFLLAQKDLIDKIAENADKANPDLLNIDSFLLSYHRDSDDISQEGVNMDLSKLKNEMTHRLPNLLKEIEQLKIFIIEFKKFQGEFDEMSSINKKIRNKNKYDGVFKKFKSITVETQQENIKTSITPSKLNNLENYSIESQSSLYETIMKKFEEIFIELDHRYFEKLKPKLEKILYEHKRLKENKGNNSSKGGFSMTNLDISHTYTKIKEDSSYLGNNPMDNIFFYQKLVGKFSNIFHNNNPKVTQVCSKAKQNLEDFFRKEEDKKENKANEYETKVPSQSIQSQNYLQKVLDKVKKKKEERDKIKLDLDFKIEDFCKVERERIFAANNVKESKEKSNVMINIFSKNDSKEKSTPTLIDDGKKNTAGIFENEKVKEEEKKKNQVESNLMSGVNVNVLNQESKDKPKEEKLKINFGENKAEKIKEEKKKEKIVGDERKNNEENTFALFNKPKGNDIEPNQNLFGNKIGNTPFGGLDASKKNLTSDNKNTTLFPSDNKNIFSFQKNDNEIKKSNPESLNAKVTEEKPSESLVKKNNEKEKDINIVSLKKEEIIPAQLPKESLAPKTEKKLGTQFDFFKISDNKPNAGNTLSTQAPTGINNLSTPTKPKVENSLLTKGVVAEPPKTANSNNSGPNQTSSNTFNNISLSNNFFSNKPPVSNAPLFTSKTINNPSNPLQNPMVPNSQPIDFMNKPAFGTKPNLGMTNPLNNFTLSSPGNAANISNSFGVSGNANTASFSQFSKNSSGLSSFTGVNQNPQSNFLTQNPLSNSNIGSSFNNVQTNPQTSGLSNFQAGNNSNFFGKPLNQQQTGFSNMQSSGNNGLNNNINNINQTNSFGSMQGNMGNNNNNFSQSGNTGNNTVQNNPVIGKNKNKPDYDLF